MIGYLMKKYTLSKQGAADYIKAVAAGVAVNLLKMLPAGLLFLLISDFLEPLM